MMDTEEGGPNLKARLGGLLVNQRELKLGFILTERILRQQHEHLLLLQVVTTTDSPNDALSQSKG